MADVPAPAPVVAPTPVVAKPAEAAKPAPVAEPTDTYIIDGVERVLTRTQARTLIQKAGAVDKRMNEVSNEKKKLEAILKAFEEDPEAALAKLGKDPSKIINDYLAKKAKQEMLSPEQQEKAKLEAEVAKYKKQQEELEQEKLTVKQQEMDAHNEKVLEDQLTEAAKKHNLDSNWETLEMMTEVALEAMELGMTTITPDQIAQEVQRRQQEHVEVREKKLLSRMSPAQLIEYVGKDRFKAMMKESLKGIPSASKPVVKAPQAPKPVNGKKYSPLEWMKLAKTGKI